MIEIYKEMMTALEESVKIWEKRTKGHLVAPCPLCNQQMVEINNPYCATCTGCPIDSYTGIGCADTPFVNYQKTKELYKMNECDEEEVFDAARLEVRFLKEVKRHCEIVPRSYSD